MADPSEDVGIVLPPPVSSNDDHDVVIDIDTSSIIAEGEWLLSPVLTE
jgi:hypothetical protein